MANIRLRTFVVVYCFATTSLFAQVCQTPKHCEAPLLAANATSPLRTTDGAASAFTFRTRVDEVSLTFSITNQRGEPVSSLSSDDLMVLDSRQPVTALRLTNYDHLRLRVGVLLDWSDSLKDGRAFERKVATDFLRQVMRPDFDDGFVMGIGVKWQLTQALTRDPEAMVRNLRPADDAWLTSLYDALIAACRGEFGKPSLDGLGRRAIILLSDGQDNESMHGLEDAIQAAQRGDVTIFPVARRGRRWDRRGERVLRQLAESTGGRAYIVQSPAEYQAAFHSIEQQLRAGYTVSYKPVDLWRDGRFRSVEIRPRDPNLKVNARSGYYAPVE